MFNKSRWVDVDVIVADIADTVARYNPGYLEMVDETFTVSRSYVMEFCQGLIDAGIKVPWGAKTRVDLVDEELLAINKLELHNICSAWIAVELFQDLRF